MEAFTQPLKKGMLGLNIEQLHDALREIGFVPDKEEVKRSKGSDSIDKKPILSLEKKKLIVNK